MKIQKIEVENLKSVSKEIIDFNGCSALITAGNGKGKSSLLRGLIDRFQGEKPSVIVRQGEKNGSSYMDFTDGSRLEWNFTEKSERFAYITKEGLKITTSVLSQIGEKYFGKRFDVDKFITASEKVQTETLAKLVGLDFSEIDQRYKSVYDERTEANRELKRLQAIKLPKPIEVDKPNLDGLKAELKEANNKNEATLSEWEKSENEALEALKTSNARSKANWLEKESNEIEALKAINESEYNSIEKFNSEQRNLANKLDHLSEAKYALENAIRDFNNRSNGELGEDVITRATEFIKKHVKPKSLKRFEAKTRTATVFEPKTREQTQKPAIVDTLLIHEKIEAENNKQRAYDDYERELLSYNSWINEGKAAAKLSTEKDNALKAIEAEKREMIEKANMPDGFSFDNGSVMYNGLPYSNNQISSSAKYIAALKLGAMALGEVRSLHFDASFLDRNSLSEVQAWAESEDLQLLIERPNFDGGEISYEIV